MDVQEGIGTGLLGAVLMKAIEVLARLVGSPKERSEAAVQNADATTKIVDAAADVIEAQRDDTKRVRSERDDCAAKLAEMDVRVRALEAVVREHAQCAPRIARLEHDQRLARRMIDGMLRIQSTPPNGLYTPADVRAALAAEET